MKNWIALGMLVCALAVAAPVAPAFAQANSMNAVNRAALSGAWRGIFTQGPDARATEFSATLTERNGQLTGTTIEQNTFGDASSFWLLGNIVGRVQGNVARFAKTYDGTAGQAHTVQYEGRIVGGRRIVGTWSIGAVSGQFEMAR